MLALVINIWKGKSKFSLTTSDAVNSRENLKHTRVHMKYNVKKKSGGHWQVPASSTDFSRSQSVCVLLQFLKFYVAGWYLLWPQFPAFPLTSANFCALQAYFFRNCGHSTSYHQTKRFFPFQVLTIDTGVVHRNVLCLMSCGFN